MEPGLKTTPLNFPTPLGFGVFLFRGSAKVSFALQEQIKDSLPVFMSEVVWWSPCCHLQNLYYWKLNFSNISRLLESFKESDLHTKWSSIQASLLSHPLPAHLLVGTEHYILRVFLPLKGILPSVRKKKIQFLFNQNSISVYLIQMCKPFGIDTWISFRGTVWNFCCFIYRKVFIRSIFLVKICVSCLIISKSVWVRKCCHIACIPYPVAVLFLLWNVCLPTRPDSLARRRFGAIVLYLSLSPST